MPSIKGGEVDENLKKKREKDLAISSVRQRKITLQPKRRKKINSIRVTWLHSLSLTRDIKHNGSSGFFNFINTPQVSNENRVKEK